MDQAQHASPLALSEPTAEVSAVVGALKEVLAKLLFLVVRYRVPVDIVELKAFLDTGLDEMGANIADTTDTNIRRCKMAMLCEFHKMSDGSVVYDEVDQTLRADGDLISPAIFAALLKIRFEVERLRVGLAQIKQAFAQIDQAV
jgi:hypothetical protein